MKSSGWAGLVVEGVYVFAVDFWDAVCVFSILKMSLGGGGGIKFILLY